MTSQIPQVITGSVVPGILNPNIRRSYFTNVPFGNPIKTQDFKVEQTNVPAPNAKGGVPHPIGDEASHHDVLSKLKDVLVNQQATQITKALPGWRDWR